MNIYNFKLKHIYYSYYILCLITMMNIFTKTLPILEGFVNTLHSFLPLIGITLVFTKKKTQFNIWFIILIILQFLGQSNHVVFDNFILIIIFYILLKDFDCDEVIKVHFYTLTAYTLLLTFCMMTGIISPVEYYLGNRYRRSLTFGHPNMLAMVLLSIHSCWFYLIAKGYFIYKFPLILSLIINIGLCFFYYDTRTGGLSLIFILILILLFDLVKKNFLDSKVLKSLLNYCWLLPILFLVVDLLLTVFYSETNYIFSKLNGLLTGRLSLQSNAFKNLGLPLFGMGIQFSIGGGLYDYVDAFYIAKIYEYGFFLQCLFVLIMSFAIWKFNKINNRLNTFVVSTLFIIYGLEGFLEKETFSFMICPFLLMLFISISKSKEVDSDDLH